MLRAACLAGLLLPSLAHDVLAGSGHAGTATDAGGFGFSQQSDASSVVLGERLTIDYLLANDGGARSGVSLEIYFLLENTSLVSAPGSCRRQPSASGQEVLHCALGDFSPGARRSIAVTVATSAASRPGVVASAFVGDLRLDLVVPVVHDVLTDSDGDGSSDFIEAIRATDPDDPASVDNSAALIDFMALHTPAAAGEYPGAVENRINELVNVANQAYAESGVRLRLRPVHFEPLPDELAPSAEAALASLLDGSHSEFAALEQLRLRHGADLVVLFGARQGAGRCGLAPIGGYDMQGDFSDAAERALGFAWVALDCEDELVLAHELGHNMGLTHSHREAGRGGTFDHATGHGVDGEFATIMATPAEFAVEARTALFSNPQLACAGHPCGREPGSELGADAAATLNVVAPQVEAWHARVLAEAPASLGSSISGASGLARLALAAQVNDEPRYTETLRVGDRLRLLAEVEVAAEHLGLAGSFHVLVSADSSEFFQLDREIGLTSWDGTLQGLRAATPERSLRVRERFHIVDNFPISADMAGLELLIYLAYQVPGDIVYLPQPLRLTISD